jgi:soluble lytic murein transglycosylase
LVIFTINAPAPRAATLSAADTQAMRSALAAAQIGDLGRAYAEAATTTDPLPLKMLRWMDCARPGAAGRFPEIAEFIEKNPDWPGQKALRKHAEEALAGESDAVAAEWLKRFPPLSTAGKIREAEILLNSGDLGGGPEALRATWIGGDFGPLDQKNFIARYSASIRPDDHTKRVDRLLWDGQTEAAHRMLPLLRRITARSLRRALRSRRNPRTPTRWSPGFRRTCAPIRGSSSSSCALGAKRI